MLTSLLVCCALVVPSFADETKIDQAQEKVEALLKKHNAAGGRISPITDKPVTQSLSGHYFEVIFPLYPVARAVPEPLRHANVVAVTPDGKVTVLNQEKELKEHFQSSLRGESLKDAARAWLRLAQVLVQDGFYQFELMDDSTKVSKTATGESVSAKVVVMKGGNGQLDATLHFDRKGKLTRIDHTAKVRPGPRPRCHATKLLHPDPVVRAIVEQDLLIMGRAAQPYLDEQRAKASPELREAIDAIRRRIIEQE